MKSFYIKLYIFTYHLRTNIYNLYQILLAPRVRAMIAFSAAILFSVSSYSYLSMSANRSRVVVVVRMEELTLEGTPDLRDIISPIY